MPTRKPKRTNWKQIAAGLELASLNWKREHDKVLAEALEWRERAAAAERHNAELLKEREARESANKTVCSGCFRHECRGECMRPVRFHAGGGITELPVVPKDAAVIEQPEVPWIVRNWVELTVMATVLGAIGFVVWRAWR